jgi:acid phosphatase type 7
VQRLWVIGCLFAVSASAAEYTYVPAGDFGRRACGAAPANWRAPEGDDRAWTQNAPADGGAGCASTVLGRWRFDVGPELRRLATLTLRVRYEHGLVAYLNGVEIARRRVDPGADLAALATETHGPEWDRLSLPLKPGMLRASGNVLAVEVHPRTRGRTPQLDVELSAADGPRIVRGPYLQRLGEHEVTVMFDTDLPTLGEVRWGPSDAYGAVLTDAPPQQHHALRLGGLQPGTAYHYRVAARGAGEVASTSAELPTPVELADAGDAFFHTPPAPGHELHFLVYGDVRSPGHDVHAQLARSILDEDPDLALVTGDLVDRGSDEGDWEKFFEVAAPELRQVAIFPAAGNHEYARLGRGVGSFLSLFRWPFRPGEDEAAYYSFDAAGVHFVALDSNQYGSSRQLAWLDKDLGSARARGARALFVFAHEGAWSSGMHGDNALCIRDFVPVLERHHVNLFFYGHDHDYERGRVGKLDYVVTGGGGAELRPSRCGAGTKKACAPHVVEFVNEHNYVAVQVLPSLFRICPKRTDGTPLAACTSYPLR